MFMGYILYYSTSVHEGEVGEKLISSVFSGWFFFLEDRAKESEVQDEINNVSVRIKREMSRHP